MQQNNAQRVSQDGLKIKAFSWAHFQTIHDHQFFLRSHCRQIAWLPKILPDLQIQIDWIKNFFTFLPWKYSISFLVQLSSFKSSPPPPAEIAKIKPEPANNQSGNGLAPLLNRSPLAGQVAKRNTLLMPAGFVYVWLRMYSLNIIAGWDCS